MNVIYIRVKVYPAKFIRFIGYVYPVYPARCKTSQVFIFRNVYPTSKYWQMSPFPTKMTDHFRAFKIDFASSRSFWSRSFWWESFSADHFSNHFTGNNKFHHRSFSADHFGEKVSCQEHRSFPDDHFQRICCILVQPVLVLLFRVFSCFC